ncbi:hypothetical protein JW935_06240 [candidate division KSB1 bacterium]|nr:hypothetical protein [candidate division KSB1 bacterium]
MKVYNNKPVAVLLVVFLVILNSQCFRKGENIPTFPPTSDSLIEDGWSAFESGKYDKAVEHFTEAKNRDAAVPDTYRGLAWSQTRALDFTGAETNFKVYMTLVTGQEDKLIDAYAGFATMYSASGQDEDAIQWCHTVVEKSPQYVFEHDARVNAKSLNTIVAKSYYNMSDYLTALNIIQEDVDNTFIQTLLENGIIAQVTGAEIKVKIPVISSTPLTSQASLTVTRQVIAGTDTSMVGVNLVKVLEIRSADGPSQYTVLSFNQGDNRINFSGNPVPRNGDWFHVDYLYAPDYGLFLSRLLSKIDEMQTL